MSWFDSFAQDLWLGPDGQAAEEAAFIKRALQLRRGQTILDAPCGAGRVTIPLAQFGLRATGVDLQKPFVEKARRRARREGLEARFRAGDLRDLDFENAFHGACCWHSALGYFDEAGNRDVLRRFVRALRPGGRLLVDQVHREWLLRHFKADVEDGGVHRRNRWDARTERMESDWMVDRDGATEHNRLSIRLYTPVQMRRLFERVGLEVEACYGSKDGQPCHRGTRRMMLVGRKT